MWTPLNTSIRTFVSARSLYPKKFTSILADVPVCPRNPWQIYLRENLSHYKTDAGKIDTKSAAKTLGKKWKSLGEAEKQVFVDAYHKEYENHKKALNEALQNATPKQFYEENRLRAKYNLTKLKDPNAPKQPINAFLIYLKHLRHTGDNKLSIVDHASMGAEKYKQLSPSEKQVYLDEAKKLREEYKVKKAAYDKLAKEE